MSSISRLRRLGKIEVTAIEAVLFFGVAVSTASAGGGGSFASTAPYWINLACYVALLWILLRKRIPSAWAARAASIEELVTSGARELERSRERRLEAEAKLARVDSERAEIAATISKDTEREVQQILAEGEAEARRIKLQAEALIKAESRAMESSVKRTLADLVVARAVSRLKAEGSAGADRARRAASVGGVKSLVGRG